MNVKVRHYIDLITVLTQKELKVRYKNSFFGYLWSVAHPLAPLVISWRNLFLEGTLRLDNLLLSVCYGIVFLTLGLIVYRKLSWRFAEVL
jgi:ABC-type polysaccharide/polyol phosphate export permease